MFFFCMFNVFLTNALGVDTSWDTVDENLEKQKQEITKSPAQQLMAVAG